MKRGEADFVYFKKVFTGSFAAKSLHRGTLNASNEDMAAKNLEMRKKRNSKSNRRNWNRSD